ncbi:HEPN domain-containing protein, partial [Aeromicrobium sp. Leaf272]|uniref:HEPN domain-containing protein n=1 Tax=Aeromicrobium sp. Leaf272 TaxID=1736317 RepID=UPI00191017D8
AAMEDIGYNIAVERDVRPGQQIREHLRRIVDEIEVDLGFDLNTWRLDVADKYRMVKHPEHPDVDSLDLLNLLRETRLLFRVWVALRLGTPKKVIERNLRLVPMHRPYVRL